MDDILKSSGFIKGQSVLPLSDSVDVHENQSKSEKLNELRNSFLN